VATRRAFLKLTGASVLGLYYSTRLGWVQRAAAAIPGGTLDPGSVPKFMTPLLIPPAMPRAGKLKVTAGKNVDYYEIAVRQFSQQVLPSGMPATTVWGYGPNPTTAQQGPVVFNAPSLTIEAKYDTPVRVKWVNELVDADGDFLPHLLPVDPTLHWANPPGGLAGRDMRPMFASTPGRYTGPVPVVTHVHGAIGVGDESDGYPEAWFLPAARNIPDGFATEGTWYEFFEGKASEQFGATWAPGSATFQYPNVGRAAADWYHDHALGMTRLNVYAGPAGFYLLRGGPSDLVLDARNGKEAILPGPAPAVGDPPGIGYSEIPLAIQDRAFNTDGSLFYPDTRAFFDDVTGPYLPTTDVSPIWNPEFFGNTLIVNGNTWPYFDVEQRRYRLRILNGCQSRFLILDFGEITGAEVWAIGNEGGFLPKPVNLTDANDNRLLMGPAERADVIIDFAGVTPGRYTLANVGPDEPFKGGEPGVDFEPADPTGTGQVMEFRVAASKRRDATTPPAQMILPVIDALPDAVTTRRLALLEQMSEFFADAPVEARLGIVDDSGATTAQHWADGVTENPAVASTEVWEIYNTTGDAHPMHIHEIKFELVNRQAIVVEEESERVHLAPGSVPMPPEPWEMGRKDTVVAYPEQVTRVRARFENPGQFVWHCHIVEHEDNEMMRPYRIGPPQPGQPGT
jgi:spore coat protein A